jgi:hypothetical protein
LRGPLRPRGLLLLFDDVSEVAFTIKALDDDDYAALRTDVTSWVAPSCGSCHTTGSPEARPAALAIFDLSKDTWPSALWANDHALAFQRTIAWRLDDQQDSALAELLGAARFREPGASSGAGRGDR